MKFDIQEKYEDILSAHWQKLFDIKGLKETNVSNHPLRLKSIADREEELKNIEANKECMELLFKYDLVVPEWYKEQIEKTKFSGLTIKAHIALYDENIEVEIKETELIDFCAEYGTKIFENLKKYLKREPTQHEFDANLDNRYEEFLELLRETR